MIRSADLNITLVRRRPRELQDMCLNVIVNNFKLVMSRPCSKLCMRCLRRKSQVILKNHETLEAVLFCVDTDLKELDIQSFPLDAMVPILRKLETVESTLSTLLLPKRISLDVLLQFINLLPKTLQCFSIKSEDFTDDMLKTVVTRCPHLQKLDLHGTSVSDSGISYLCDKDQMGNISKNFIVQKLLLSCTKVTRVGVVFALENFPNLCVIRNGNLTDVIYDMHQTAILSNSSSTANNTCNLKAVHIEGGSLPRVDVLKAFISLCPYITGLEVLISSEAELNACSHFTMLENVFFLFPDPCNLIQFFETRGKSLKKVTLCCSAECFVSAEAIVKYCPQLRCLKISFIEEATFTEVKLFTNHCFQYTLPNLTKIVVSCSCYDNLEDSLLFIMTRSPNLETFKLEYAHWAPLKFSLTFMESFVQCCVGLSSLKELHLRNVADVHKLRDAMQNFAF